jgi:uncharacterized Zn-finger protein
MEEKSSSSHESHAASHPSGQVRTITDVDLPLVCPLPSSSQWDAHPRVFLTLDDEGMATCPYCGTTYRKESQD